MKEITNKVKLSAVRSLTRLVMTALESATLQIEAQASQFSNTQLPPLREESPTIAESFMINLNSQFDALYLPKVVEVEAEVAEYGNLSLVDDDYLEAIIAMEGMVNHARNCDIQQYISFTTRLDTLFPNLHIDETNNPLDPEQIGDCFNNAVKPLGLKAHYLLTIYREFNKEVFHQLEEVLAEANEVLIKCDVLPKLDIKARNREIQRKKRAINRPTTDRETRAFEEAEASGETVEENKQANAEMFSMMQTLVKSLAEREQNSQSSLPVTPPAQASSNETTTVEDTTTELSNEELQKEQNSLKEQQAKLLEMLGDIQSSINSSDQAPASEEEASGNSRAITESISKSLEAGSEAGEIGPISAQSSDVINLVTLLYEAIWSDDSLPVVMKELIGRTQISIMKTALLDTGFFDNEQHPGRILLNEFAMAGIAWTEISMLESDPVYSKVKELVERLLAETNADNDFLQSLLDDLHAFKSKHGQSDVTLEQRLRESDDHSDRLDDVNEFVTQKIDERIIRSDLDPSIRNLLDTHFHDFLVKLVLKEGPGGSSWKPVMSTIDVLLWTVKKDKDPGDKKRFEKINPRLLDNIEKALEIGGASKSKAKKIMRQLKQVQEYSYHMAEISNQSPSQPSSQPTATESPVEQPRKKKELPPLPRSDPHLRQVDKFPIGIWLEFKGAAGQPVRCTLAAKIDSIDKMFFVNRQGVKVVELDRMRLARELKAGSVKIVSEGSLVDRAMESVISNLRESSPKQAQA
ncbi:MAG: DUF1631 family protein [Gammaproteobacteria bacterium]|jgi:hypothetical protein|nr:DUF1631 family protein [Gammaproteobacteria bacterium]MBT3859838.1 DUF1631 family protein [Gammaproteobacteria bacterium]MBT3988508.1 DUF1631 family protein [Gammaproteobacteria bacterium]MBT4256605.1 DUF1631 family protein [Gammaproteobacteria bacterium]MBT4583178.1 DUF1631 family protein [Gammaproteobacteria bacterium]